ncbi:hypothetical protein GQ54DRAFT_103561 [Martensiomyces pterosporus]|nr:hypothetical protein GQ54DRAFT_103561 [Martensiomyces pterosporus]
MSSDCECTLCLSVCDVLLCEGRRRMCKCGQAKKKSRDVVHGPPLLRTSPTHLGKRIIPACVHAEMCGEEGRWTRAWLFPLALALALALALPLPTTCPRDPSQLLFALAAELIRVSGSEPAPTQDPALAGWCWAAGSPAGSYQQSIG